MPWWIQITFKALFSSDLWRGVLQQLFITIACPYIELLSCLIMFQAFLYYGSAWSMPQKATQRGSRNRVKCNAAPQSLSLKESESSASEEHSPTRRGTAFCRISPYFDHMSAICWPYDANMMPYVQIWFSIFAASSRWVAPVQSWTVRTPHMKRQVCTERPTIGQDITRWVFLGAHLETNKPTEWLPCREGWWIDGCLSRWKDKQTFSGKKAFYASQRCSTWQP